MIKKEAKAGLYRIRLYPVDIDTTEVQWVAEVPDLAGCVGSGDTPEEAVAMARDAQRGWIDLALSQGTPIPEPTYLNDSEYSGKFTLRLPKTLHKDLTLQAQEEGVSLNQYIIFLVSQGLYNHKTSVVKEEQSATGQTVLRFRNTRLNEDTVIYGDSKTD